MKILIYALGGGLGHLQRAIALGRRLKKSCQLSIVTNSPFAHFAQKEGLKTIQLSGSKKDIEDGVKELFSKTSADVLIVDTFPAGPTGELARLNTSLPKNRCLIHRSLHSYNVERPWPTYELIINSEATAEVTEIAKECHSKKVVELGPLLLRSKKELLGKEEARAALGVGGSGKVLLVYHHGYQREVEALFRLCRTAFLRIAPENWQLILASLRPLEDKSLEPFHMSYWPLQELLLGADAVVTAGGYHSWYESALAKRPAIVIPMSRKFDCQRSRVTDEVRQVSSPAALEEALEKLFFEEPRQRKEEYHDYSEAAAIEIYQFFSSQSFH